MITGTLAWDEKAELSNIKTRDDLAAYAQTCWKAADASYVKITDAQLAAKVKAPWGEMPGFALLDTIPDEYVHHRGQLYAYLRQLGVEPPSNSDFEHSSPELRPRQHACGGGLRLRPGSPVRVTGYYCPGTQREHVTNEVKKETPERYEGALRAKSDSAEQFRASMCPRTPFITGRQSQHTECEHARSRRPGRRSSRGRYP